MHKWIRYLFLIIFLIVIGLPARVFAQDQNPPQPVYIVQEGDNLTSIAIRFDLSLDELVRANPSISANSLMIGDQLVIPGLQGVNGVLDTAEIGFGDTLTSLAHRYAIPVSALIKLNHITSPAELYVGANLIIPQPTGDNPLPGFGVTSLKPGESLLELAVRTGSNPWSLVQANELTGSAQAVLGESLVFQSPDGESLSSLDGVVRSIEITPLPLVQGRTTSIQIETLSPAGFTGQLGDAPLHFFSSGQNQAIALQGIHAMLDPGIIPLTIQGRAEDGAEFSYTQMVRVISGNYIQDLPLNVPPATIDPANTGPENELWANIFVEATPDKRWEGGFAFPSKIATLQYCLDTGDCWTSFFGNRRSYNGSPYQYFHTGLDIAGQTGAEILAPAPGIVVFTGELTVRGGATVIDHGWGVYTAYEHQSDIQVEVGDVVETGQVIGLVGATGRVEGPHLHWEVVVGGVAVDPLDWLERVYP